ncbi:MAG TPA: rhodanese-like domain-containing protein [Flavipsychrobacter sp.]|nr:rhodanese-like domain-containing protein [Flavipsychrobacter sp.]
MKEITPGTLKRLIDSAGDLVLIDVREEWERSNYNIGGTHIPLGELIIRQVEIPKEKTVVFYCEKGIRSAIAIQRLEALGYHNLYNLTGGIKAWKAMK